MELLISIAIIAILSGLLIPQIAKTKEAANVAVARQQQAELQAALGNWITAKSSEGGGLAAAREAFTGNKLALLQNYLQEATYLSLTGTGDTVTSAALSSARAELKFSTWSSSSEQPRVEWINK